MRGKRILATLLAAMITAGGLLSVPVYAEESTTAVETAQVSTQATTADTTDYSKLNQQIKNGAAAVITTKTVSAKNPLFVGANQSEAIYASGHDLNDFFDYQGNYTVVYPSTGGGDVYIVRFDKQLEKKKTLKIKSRGLYGDAICDNQGNYYIAWGKEDTKGKGGVTTFFVSKYRYDGTYVKSCAFKSSGEGSETMIPFHAGTCDMTIQDNLLVCSYARTMYNGHQSSCVFTVNINTMKELTYPSGPDNYASHSFNQRVISLKNGGFLFADHGDSFPRGFQLTESVYDEEWDGYNNESVVPFHFYGSGGQNYTNAYLGDIGETEKDYVLVASSAKAMTKKMEYAPQQLFLQLIDKKTKKPRSIGSKRSGTSCGEKTTDTGVKWLTNYTDGSSVSHAKLVVLENGNLFVAWERFYPYNGETYPMAAYYMILSSEGKVLQNATLIPGREFNADESMKYRDGKIYWATSTNTVKVDAADALQIHTLQLGTVKNPSIKDTAITFSKDTYTYNGKAQKPKPQIWYGGKKLKEGKDYKITSYKNNKGVGLATINIAGKGTYSGTVQAQFRIRFAAPTKMSVRKTADGYHKVTWSSVKGADGYEVYRVCAIFKNGFVEKDLSAKFVTKKTSYVDKLKNKNAVFSAYTVRAYKTINGEKLFGNENYYTLYE